MKYGSLILEKKEYVYLKRILNISGYVGDFEIQKSFQRLHQELKSAHIVDETEIPKDVIRFNSKVKVKSNNGWERVIQIVSPVDKDVEQGKVSILTPMGSALFGYSESDVIDWNFPSGMQKLEIVAVSQDELLGKIEVFV